MRPNRFWFYAALVQVTRKHAPVFCRRCHRLIQVMGDPQVCGPHYCSPACQETARHAGVGQRFDKSRATEHNVRPKDSAYHRFGTEQRRFFRYTERPFCEVFLATCLDW